MKADFRVVVGCRANDPMQPGARLEDLNPIACTGCGDTVYLSDEGYDVVRSKGRLPYCVGCATVFSQRATITDVTRIKTRYNK